MRLSCGRRCVKLVISSPSARLFCVDPGRVCHTTEATLRTKETGQGNFVTNLIVILCLPSVFRFFVLLLLARSAQAMLETCHTSAGKKRYVAAFSDGLLRDWHSDGLASSSPSTTPPPTHVFDMEILGFQVDD